VLKKEHRERNLFDPRWWRYIAGQEHRWASALNSSQCFAVNVFAPLAEDSDLAKAVWARIYPHRPLDPADTVLVEFEHTPQGADEWLGERRQQTQVDVFFTVRRGETTVGHLLVEVKFTETEFGECRGAKPPTAKRAGNPDRSRCLDLGANPLIGGQHPIRHSGTAETRIILDRLNRRDSPDWAVGLTHRASIDCHQQLTRVRGRAGGMGGHRAEAHAETGAHCATIVGN